MQAVCYFKWNYVCLNTCFTKSLQFNTTESHTMCRLPRNAVIVRAWLFDLVLLY